MDKTIEFLKSYLLQMDDTAWEDFRNRLEEGDISSYDIFFRSDLSNDERDEIDFRIRLQQLDKQFSDKIYPVQRELLIKLNLLHFDWPDSNKLSFSNLSNKLRFGFIPEHQDVNGSFNPNREHFHREFRNLLREYGEDVRPSDILTEEELEICKNASRKGISDLERLGELGVSEVLIPPLREQDKHNTTIKGHIAQWLCLRNYADLSAAKVLGTNSDKADSQEDFDTPLRLNHMFRHLYHSPDSYERIIRDYYDLTEGFLHVGRRLMRRGYKLFRRLKVMPTYTGAMAVEPAEDYYKFRDFLIRQKCLKEESVAKIEDYFYQAVGKEYVKLTRNLYLFVFVVALLFKEDFPGEYKRYTDFLRNYLDKLQDTYLALNAEKTSRYPRKSRVAKLTTPLDMLVTDLRSMINGNMILFCIFYNYLFHGEKHIERKLPSYRPGHPKFINDIIVYLVNELAPGNKKITLKKVRAYGYEYGFSAFATPGSTLPTPYNVARKFLQLLTLLDVDVAKQYAYWKDKSNTSVISNIKVC